jgi:hypothetical protein
MKSDILQKLNSDDYSIASNCLNEFLKAGNINRSDLIALLSINNTLIISDFLERYKNFHEKDLKLIENYINRNLDHTDRLFVSDLIEFSTNWGLFLPYNKCLQFLEKFGDDEDYVLLASIDYIFENLKFAKIDEIFNLLCLILYNPESNQSAQVKAAFVLFRITNKKKFMIDLVDLIVNGYADNKILLRNMLNLKYNNSSYFEHYDLLNAIIKPTSDELQTESN